MKENGNENRPKGQTDLDYIPALDPALNNAAACCRQIVNPRAAHEPRQRLEAI